MKPCMVEQGNFYESHENGFVAYKSITQLLATLRLQSNA